MNKLKFELVLLLFFFSFVKAQQPQKLNAVEIYSKIQKLNFLGSVLYIAAHPDDENTRLITYFSNEKKARTGYLSLTRGDGGQNLIGPELRELLGVIRTQELIEARKIDGGEQFFSRANDFGFSKNPEETLQIWDKEQVLSDLIWVIRKFQPDVIINRFDHRTSGTTHGHHTASAILSLEGFDKANDSSVFSNQLQLVSTWQPKRIFFNTSWWFYGSKEKFEQADKSNLVQIETGVYYPSIGKSNQEIAALSRSCHQSQGFGTTGVRGQENEYLEFLKGEPLKEKNNLFEGIDTTWNRIKGGNEIGIILANVEKNFDFKNPEASIPELVKAYNLIQKLDDTHWKTIKLEEIKSIIVGCTGLYLEAVADVQEATENQTVKVKIEVINRSSAKMEFGGVTPSNDKKFTIKSLEKNVVYYDNLDYQIDSNTGYTNPYWLNEIATEGMYRVNNQEDRGKPDVIRKNTLRFHVIIEGVALFFDRNIIYKYNDEAKGETYQPLDIVPPVTSSIQEKVSLFSSQKEKTLAVKITSGKDNITGSIALEVPQNWNVSPASISFSLAKKGEEQVVSFTVLPPKEASEAIIKSKITVAGKEYDQSKTNINYPHIYNQMVLSPSQAKVIRLNLKTKGEKIAYIMGSGDNVPECLKQMEYEVVLLKPEEITTERLNYFDVVITGIRAYNVLNTLALKQNILFDFVKNGKTMIVQYNTTDNLVTKEIAPFPLKISQDRVTQENAQVQFLAPKHAVLNYPNTITATDFEGWKQEQGLYYPKEWDSNFTPILSSNDKGENPKNGALLIAKYGKGYYIYTGLSFFRELPQGVSGAYRLLANMIAIGK